MDKEMFRYLRLYHGMTQDEFAERLGVSGSTIDGVEGGARSLTPFIRARVATNFIIDDDFLKSYENYKRTSV